MQLEGKEIRRGDMVFYRRVTNGGNTLWKQAEVREWNEHVRCVKLLYFIGGGAGRKRARQNGVVRGHRAAVERTCRRGGREVTCIAQPERQGHRFKVHAEKDGRPLCGGGHLARTVDRWQTDIGPVNCERCKQLEAATAQRGKATLP